MSFSSEMQATRVRRNGLNNTTLPQGNFDIFLNYPEVTSIKNIQIEKSLKDEGLYELNDLLTHTFLNAKSDLIDLSNLTTKKLGPKAALYQQFFDESQDPLSYESREMHGEDLFNKTHRKNDSLDENKFRQSQRKTTGAELNDLTIPTEMMMNQLKVCLLNSP